MSSRERRAKDRRRIRSAQHVVVSTAVVGSAAFGALAVDVPTAGAVTFSPGQVANINTTPRGGEPGGATAVGGTIYFTATEPGTGTELWKTDGTGGGTSLVDDIVPGSVGSDPVGLTNVNGTLFFVVPPVTGSNVGGIWTSDGTAAGTKQLTTEDPNDGYEIANVGGTLFFASGHDLGTSNGTVAGTTDVLTNLPGDAQAFTAVGSEAYFLVGSQSGAGVTQLWKSDGTAANTQAFATLTNLNAGEGGGSGLYDLTNAGGTLFFTGANATNHDSILYSATGATVTPLLTGGESNYVNGYFGGFGALTVVNGTLFFDGPGANQGSLWTANATHASVVTSAVHGPQYLTDVNGALYFTDSSGSTFTEDRLWTSDGTAGGTQQVPVNAMNLGGLVNGAGELFFKADTASTGYQLWVSNGTAGGTSAVSAINGGDQGSDPTGFTNVNGNVFFTANDGTNAGALWMSNGTGATQLTAARAYDLTAAGSTLFFTASTSNGTSELWESNGAAGAAAVVESFANAGRLTQLTAVNGSVFFDIGGDLYVSDGSVPGTHMLSNHPYAYGDPGDLTNVNGTLFYTDAPNGGSALYSSTGTVDGTTLVPAIENPSQLTNVNGTLFLDAYDTSSESQRLFTPNGTNATVVPNAPSDPERLVNVNGTLAFLARQSDGQDDLWQSDGTGSGTFDDGEVISPGGFGGYGTGAVVGGTLFFAGDEGVHGSELWSSAAGLRRAAAGHPGIPRRPRSAARRTRWGVAARRPAP